MLQNKLTKWNYLFLIVWGVFLTSCLFFYLTFLQPAKLIPRLETTLEKYLLGEAEIQAVNINFFPSPSFTVENFQYIHSDENAPDVATFMKKLELVIDWRTLIEFELVLDTILLEEPHIQLVFKSNTQKNENENFGNNKIAEIDALIESIPQSIKNTSLEMKNATIEWKIQDENAKLYTLKNIDASVKNLNQVEFSIDKFPLEYLNVSTDIGATISNLSFSLNHVSFEEDGILANLFLQTDISLYNDTWNNTLQTKGEIKINPDFTLAPLEHKVDILTRFSLPTQHIDGRLMFDLHYENLNTIAFENSKLEIEDNIINFSAKLDELTPKFKASAKVDIEHLSLTRWLSFARDLPPTLSGLLHTIHGEGNIIFTENSIIANGLKAYTGEYSFAVEGGYSFKERQELDLKLIANEINIDNIFPEPLGKDTQSLEFKQIALDTEFDDGSVDNNPEDDFYYQVEILADKVSYYKFKGEQAKVVIKPHEKGVQLPIEIGKFNSGKVDALLLLGDDIGISGNISKVSVSSFLAPFLNAPIIEGYASGKVDYLGKGENLLIAFDQLAGKTDLTISDGAFVHKDGNVPFDDLIFQSNVARNTSAKSNDGKNNFIRTLFGSASLKVQHQDYEALLKLPSAIAEFDRNKIQLQNIKSEQALIDFKMKHLPQLAFSSYGKFAFNYPNQSIDYNSITGKGKDFSLIGNVHYKNFANPVVNGRVDLLSNTFLSFLKSFGLELPELKDKTAWAFVSAKLPFTYKDLTLDIKSLHGQLDETYIEGDVFYNFDKSKDSRIHLKIDKINLDRYTTAKMQTNAPPLSSNKEIPLKLLATANVSGNIFAKELWIAKTPFLNANLPFSLENKIIKFSPTANFPKSGSIAFDGNGKIYEEYLLFDTKIRGNDIDLLELTKARGQQTLMAGLASFEINESSIVKTYKDIFASLAGSFSFRAQNGYFASSLERKSTNSLYPQRSEVNEKKNKLTYSNISFSGTASEGILTSTNVLVNGSIHFRGNAKVDLVKWLLSVSGNLQYAQFPQVPINIAGHLSDPELSLQIIKAITNALENFGTGVLNTFSGIIKIPFDVLNNTLLKN